ncbi:hypothetical protein MGG_17586 [Pyricularia oryzae 70-15]|uniref:Chromo domain-containing protein n=1 Tax=Pyricularia oryzae (strain 70-15 / ATCC MYA-4617 / FGSC 8958) TaxID=242507 RepID=G4NFY1_PYRO7|nr:uncharacterized protein MGG_17586 [Pyricularia oryzae 70-15]EHA46938.1 hypothetical protein MGG_17586 [Pyricularia oryzae 70-15]
MDPLPQQKREPPPPEEINGEPEFVVDKVLASRLFGRSKILQYQVAWQGCDPDDTWYPAENFKNSATALDDFHKKYKDAAGPPKRLAIWIKAAAEDKLDEPNQEDNVAEHGELNGNQVTDPKLIRTQVHVAVVARDGVAPKMSFQSCNPLLDKERYQISPGRIPHDPVHDRIGCADFLQVDLRVEKLCESVIVKQSCHAPVPLGAELGEQRSDVVAVRLHVVLASVKDAPRLRSSLLAPGSSGVVSSAVRHGPDRRDRIPR